MPARAIYLGPDGAIKLVILPARRPHWPNQLSLVACSRPCLARLDCLHSRIAGERPTFPRPAASAAAARAAVRAALVDETAVVDTSLAAHLSPTLVFSGLLWSSRRAAAGLPLDREAASSDLTPYSAADMPERGPARLSPR